ncbi:MAG: hypothetical protein R2697_06045 [Ilumatobacteraceae bacterium]
MALQPTPATVAFPPETGPTASDGAGVVADAVMLTWGGFISNRDGTNTGGDDGIIDRPPAD